METGHDAVYAEYKPKVDKVGTLGDVVIECLPMKH